MPANIQIALVTVLLIIFLFQSSSYSAESGDKKDPLTERPMTLGTHRGGRHEWPENTLVAYAEAAQRWPDALLEADVHNTADGHVVVIHDYDVKRTTNGEGLVSMMTLEELQSLDAAWHFSTDGGATFPYRGKGIRIPTLGEVLALAPRHRILIEMKEGEKIAETTVAAIREADAVHRCILAAAPPGYIAEVRRLEPGMATCCDILSAASLLAALRSDAWADYAPEHRALALSPSLQKRFQLTPDELQKIRQKGILVIFFTVNQQDEMRQLLDMGVDSILTDYPSRLWEVINHK